MMKKLALSLAVCFVGIFDEALSMESYVDNPVNAIVEQYHAVTPQSTIESFKKSTEKLLQDIVSSEAHYKDNALLRAKWEAGIAVLKDIFLVNHSSQSDLETLFTRVSDITDNGFYDVSNTIITIDSTKKNLKPLFEDLWHHLLQAREITAWWVCSDPRVAIEEVPYLCFEACGLVKNPTVSSILWSISILGGVSQAIQELNESGEPSETEILEAKRGAKQILKRTMNGVPALSSSLERFIEIE